MFKFGKRRTELESNFKVSVREYLNRVYRDKIVIVNYVNVMYPGVSDLLVCYEGRFIALELKTNSSVSRMQHNFLQAIVGANGLGVLLYNHPGWKEYLKEILSNAHITNTCHQKTIYLSNRDC